MQKITLSAIFYLIFSVYAFAQLGSVHFFAYQIQMLDEPGAIDSIVDSRYDMVILEPTRTEQGMEDFDAAGMVAAIKASPGTVLPNKTVLAYIDIGQAEDWRYYWEPWWIPPTDSLCGIPDFLITIDPDGWSGCYPVAYWDIRWQNIMVNYDSSMLKKAIADGFDGIYMDWVEAYDDISVIAAADSEGVDPVQEIIGFITTIRDTARNYNPDFLVVAQNGADLCDGHPEYFSIIDGIAQEDLSFYGEGDVDWDDPLAGDIPQDPSYKAYLITVLDQYLAAGLPVFTVDYALVPTNITSAYSFSGLHGYIPFVTQTPLSQLPPYTPPGYTQVIESSKSPKTVKIKVRPNPFNSAATIDVGGVAAVSARGRNGEGQIALEIYDIAGRLVCDLPLPSGGTPEGATPPTWQPDESIPSGVYMIKAEIGTTISTGKAILIR